MIAYSSDVLTKTVNLLVNNQRDLRDPSLRDVYEVEFTAQKDIDSRYSQVLDFRIKNGLPTINRGAFASFTTVSSGQAFFERVLNSLGIETISESDVVRQQQTSIAPTLQSFIDKQARTIPVQKTSLQEELSSVEITTLHLTQTIPSVVSDEDDDIFSRIRNINVYARGLVR